MNVKFTLRLITILRDLLDLCIKEGLFKKEIIRNFLIELSYNENILNGMRPKDSRYKVAEDYYLSEKSIQHIIYKQKN